MADEARTVLRLLGEGHISVEEADRLLAALDREARSGPPPPPPPPAGPPPPPSEPSPPRSLRVRIREGGRQVVNLHVPVSLAASAAALVPGLSEEQVGRIRAAIESGTPTTIVDVEDEDSSVLVSLE
jgi:hypothetical protein